MTEYLNISLSNDADINNDIFAVCGDITEHYKTLVPNGPPLGHKPLQVIHNPSTPIAVVDGLPHYYSIGLTTNERWYAQIAYQFAHELTHIYCDPRITNWFIESICEMASLYFLNYLSDKWKTQPPFEHWKDYAINFDEYKRNRIKEAKANLTISNETELQTKFLSIIQTINEPYNRDKNTIIALRLIEVFEDNVSWSLLQYLGQSTDKILVDYSFIGNSIPDFDKLLVASTDNNKEIAERIKALMKNSA